MSSGGGSSNTNTVTQSDPWAGQQPYLLNLFQQAQQQYQQGGPQYYQGAGVAAPSQATTAGQNAMLSAASGGVQQNVDAANEALRFNLNDAKDIDSNPYLRKAIDAATGAATRNYFDAGGIQSQIRDQAGDMGTGYGYGSRGDIATGLGVSRLNQGILDTTSAMANRGYESGLEASTKALALAPGISQMNAMPAEMMSAVGAQQDQYQQALINEAIQKWNFEQNRPGNALAAYQNLIQGNFGGQQTGQASGPAYQPTGMQTAASAATMAYLAYLMMA